MNLMIRIQILVSNTNPLLCYSDSHEEALVIIGHLLGTDSDAIPIGIGLVLDVVYLGGLLQTAQLSRDRVRYVSDVRGSMHLIAVSECVQLN